jgi:hypothetical protein
MCLSTKGKALLLSCFQSRPHPLFSSMHDNSSSSPVTHHFWDEAAAILSGLIGGGRYGLKIRVPHAVGKQSVYTKHDFSHPSD